MRSEGLENYSIAPSRPAPTKPKPARCRRVPDKHSRKRPQDCNRPLCASQFGEEAKRIRPPSCVGIRLNQHAGGGRATVRKGSRFFQNGDSVRRLIVGGQCESKEQKGCCPGTYSFSHNILPETSAPFRDRSGFAITSRSKARCPIHRGPTGWMSTIRRMSATAPSNPAPHR